MYNNHMKENKRVTVYLPEDEHKKLKSILALKGENVSAWVRDQITKFLKENNA